MILRVRTTLVLAVALSFGACESNSEHPVDDATQSSTLHDSLIAGIRRGAIAHSGSANGDWSSLIGDPMVPQVHVRVNGRGPYTMLLDLGSNVTVLRRDVVDAGHVEVLVDRDRSDICRVATMEINGIVFEQVVVASYDTLDVAGVLGFNLLDDLAFTLDYPRKRFRFDPDTAVEPAGYALSYELIDRLPYITAVVGPDTFELNLDTGASEFMTMPLTWKDRFAWSNTPAPGPTLTNNQTGSIDVLQAELSTALRLGDIEMDSVPVFLNADAEDAWLGSAALQDRSISFRPDRMMVVIGR